MATEKRLIDANALIDWIDMGHLRNPLETCYSERDVVDMLESRPTVDAEEVVRCKDCKHWKPSGSMAGNSEDDLQPIGGCEWANCCRKANDFCSYGERRTDNERKTD